MSDIQRSIDLAAEIRRVDGDHSLGAAALAEALEPWLDAVIAAVRKDMRSAFREEIETLKPSEWRQEGRQAAARDIRAAIDDEHWDFDWRDGMDTAAQIAEGK